MHPFAKHNEHRKSHSRVGHILKSGGHASGGAAHSDAAADRKLFGRMMAEHEHKVGGHKGASRFARGGKTKKSGGHHTNIAVVVPQSKPAAAAGPLPGAGGAPPPMPLPPPPGGPGGPPGLPPGLMKGPGGPGGPPMPPPGMPPGGIKRGGRIKRAHGGRIKREDGGRAPASEDSSQGKEDRESAVTKYMGPRGGNYTNEMAASRTGQKRGGAIKRASGGRTPGGEPTKGNLDAWSARASKNSYARGGAASMTAGAASGEGRLEKAGKS